MKRVYEPDSFYVGWHKFKKVFVVTIHRNVSFLSKLMGPFSRRIEAEKWSEFCNG